MVTSGCSCLRVFRDLRYSQCVAQRMVDPRVDHLQFSRCTFTNCYFLLWLALLCVAGLSQKACGMPWGANQVFLFGVAGRVLQGAWFVAGGCRYEPILSMYVARDFWISDMKRFPLHKREILFRFQTHVFLLSRTECFSRSELHLEFASYFISSGGWT